MRPHAQGKLELDELRERVRHLERELSSSRQGSHVYCAVLRGEVLSCEAALLAASLPEPQAHARAAKAETPPPPPARARPQPQPQVQPQVQPQARAQV